MAWAQWRGASDTANNSRNLLRNRCINGEHISIFEDSVTVLEIGPNSIRYLKPVPFKIKTTNIVQN